MSGEQAIVLTRLGVMDRERFLDFVSRLSDLRCFECASPKSPLGRACNCMRDD